MALGKDNLASRAVAGDNRTLHQKTENEPSCDFGLELIWKKW